MLCEQVRDIMMEESNIQPVSSPVTVCGDIHGQFYDLLELFRVGGSVPETSYIFMVCDTSNLRETLLIAGTFLSRLSPCCWPSRRGIPTESRSFAETTRAAKSHRCTVFMVRVSSDADECMQKYGSAAVWKSCCQVFDYLNIAAVSTSGADPDHRWPRLVYSWWPEPRATYARPDSDDHAYAGSAARGAILRPDVVRSGGH